MKSKKPVPNLGNRSCL